MSVAAGTARGPGGTLAAVRRAATSDAGARIASYLFLLVVWQLISIFQDRFPGPIRVVRFLLVEVTAGRHGGVVRGQFLEHFVSTLPRFGIGIAIALAVGTATGILIGASQFSRAILKDTMLVLLALPAIIWAFLTVMWFGLGDRAVVITTVLSAFPFVTVNVAQGVQATPPELRRMSTAFGVGFYRRIRHMQVPAVTGYLFAGLRFAVIIGWNAVLLAEWFAASAGVGWRSRYWYDANRYQGFVGWVVIFIVFIVLLDRLVLIRLQRRAFRWRDAHLSEIEREAEEVEVGVTGS